MMMRRRITATDRGQTTSRQITVCRYIALSLHPNYEYAGTGPVKTLSEVGSIVLHVYITMMMMMKGVGFRAEAEGRDETKPEYEIIIISFPFCYNLSSANCRVIDEPFS